MTKPPFMEVLEEKLRPEERIFKFRTAELTDENFKLELLVGHEDYDALLDDALKNKISEISQKIIPSSFTLSVRFVKANNNENSIIKHVLEFIYKEKPTVFSGFQCAPIEIVNSAELITIRITLEKYLHEYATNSGLKKELEEYLSTWTMEDVEIQFIEIPNSGDITIIARPQEYANTIRTINVDITNYYSGGIAQNPRYILDVKDKESAQTCLCGIISNIQERYIEKIDKTLYSFMLNDTTATIRVKYFAKKLKTVDWTKVFVDGHCLVMQGQIKYDNFDSAFTFYPRSLARCIIEYGSINLKSEFLPEPKEYIYIRPQKIEAGIQANMLASAPNPELLEKEFVVFDLETTGLEATRDKIIELAAVKIRNGEICESFDSLINPKMELPLEIVKLTHITDEMLIGCYTIEDIIGDFYKFTRGAILVAHNAPFDMGFLSIAGKNSHYDFDNAYMDTLAMSRQKLKLKSNKLESVCEHFKVSLVGAHRAINDTLATAKIFIELMNL